MFSRFTTCLAKLLRNLQTSEHDCLSHWSIFLFGEALPPVSNSRFSCFNLHTRNQGLVDDERFLDFGVCPWKYRKSSFSIFECFLNRNALQDLLILLQRQNFSLVLGNRHMNLRNILNKQVLLKDLPYFGQVLSTVFNFSPIHAADKKSIQWLSGLLVRLVNELWFEIKAHFHEARDLAGNQRDWELKLLATGFFYFWGVLLCENRFHRP